MTKRLVEFVETLGRDELLEIVILGEERYREKAWEVTKEFFQTKEIFLHHILSRLGRLLGIGELYRLRLVSKEWNCLVRETESVRFDDYTAYCAPFYEIFSQHKSHL